MPTRADRAPLSWLALALVAFVPLLATRPGLIAADTKFALYLDPGRLLASAASMWNPDVGLGTVTHQNIGYLFPMGPWFWAVHALGVPTWVGQRLWMGTLLLAAGAGVRFCARQLGLSESGALVAGLGYMLSPYIVDYLARTSAILLPWAALGWLVGLTVLAARRGGWRHPALIALVVFTVGGINATSIILAAVAPALWLVWAGVTGEVPWRRVGGVALRVSGLSILVSLWWIAGLYVEAAYGLNILRVTETVPTVARTSSAAEVLRGLGYWYFYGQDKVQPWTEASVPYTQSLWLIAVTFVVPVVSILLGGLVRWRYRAYAAALVLVGVVIAVGVYPYGSPSVLGAALKAGSGSSLGLALRSADRAVPGVVLGLMLLLGAGVTALRVRWRRLGLLVATVGVVMVGAALPPLWQGTLVASNLASPSPVPSYWQHAASYLDAGGTTTRVLGLPGEDFAAYRWGVTQDQIAPSLLDRPYVDRQVVPQGEPGSVDLLEALDEQVQEQTLDPAAIAPIARLMSVGQILVQADLQYERYAQPQPQTVAELLAPTPPGLGPPVGFGPPAPTPVIKYPLVNADSLAVPTGAVLPQPLTAYSVAGARPIVRTEPTAEPLLVAGSGTGLVEAASTGLLDGNPTVLYSASSDAAAFSRAMADGADLVLTDTNTKSGERWGGLSDNQGLVEQADVSPLGSDPSDYPLPLFPGASSASQTVAVVSGVSSVRATGYGNPISYTPEDQPINAFDHDPNTAWVVGAFSPVDGQRIQVDLDRPVTTDHLTLRQPADPTANRSITRVALRFDGGHPVTVDLGAGSRRGAGQEVRFPTRTFAHLTVTITGNSRDGSKRFDGLSPVGFSEIGIPGVAAARQSLRLPTGLLSRAGAASAAHRLVVVLARQRAAKIPRSDPEPDMSRTFTLPTARTFSVAGTARIAPGDSDYLINQLVGLTPPVGQPLPTAAPGAPGPARLVAANSSTRLSGDLRSRANAAVDGNPATAWIAQGGPQAGEWLQLLLDRPTTFDHLDLQVVADGRHSIPTRITITTASGSRTVDLPAVATGTGWPQGATTTVPLHFAPLTGDQVRITIDAARPVTTLDYFTEFTGKTDTLPVALAEVGLPGVAPSPAPPATIPVACRSDLLRIDGRPVDVQVTGATTSALAGGALQIRACGSSAGGVTLGPGTHVVQTNPRLPAGWDVDGLTLASDKGGGPLAPTSAAAVPAPAATSSPAVRILHQDRTSMSVRVVPDGRAFWLVLGQSQTSGWRATLPGGRSLGPSQLIDGYANGWYIPASALSGAATIHLTWTPQRLVWGALGVSALGVVTAAVLAAAPPGLAAVRPEVLAGRWRRRPRRRPGRDRPPAGHGAWAFTPQLVGLADIDRVRPSSAIALLAAVVGGAVAAVVARPATGGVVALGMFVVLRLGHGRRVLTAGAGAAAAATGLYVLVQQHRYRYWPTIDWPSDVSLADALAWLAVCLLAADAAVEVVRHWRTRRRD